MNKECDNLKSVAFSSPLKAAAMTRDFGANVKKHRLEIYKNLGTQKSFQFSKPFGEALKSIFPPSVHLRDGSELKRQVASPGYVYYIKTEDLAEFNTYFQKAKSLFTEIIDAVGRIRKSHCPDSALDNILVELHNIETYDLKLALQEMKKLQDRLRSLEASLYISRSSAPILNHSSD